ncbi:peptide/nickel transport system substrate-binding protein [Mesorhizobium albiziae]|uniref:Peptide/nickel transport system substrate-binding protein n=2 Tax=Neomesorhizobium albiziae TaxID=335020 RepID=A0A1I4BSU2_9HYPH|nr:extracellular solute-binding protein [Mesorhizobium albiziae]GLS29666.1 ABC transporter substrate-binding protein [Mesorhizobium albiziae]SFK71878.1 peptide/nickel transport system substrate-binding protein [Mesorhizobium albiziae]
MRHLLSALLLAGFCAITPVSNAIAEPRHAIAMQGEPGLPADFAHFPYANPDAPKGGSVNYCVVGSFDNLNPFIIKSLRTTARGVIDTIFGNLVFEPLMQRSADEAFSLYGLLAESIDITPDRKIAEFNLNPKAKWSDGRPVRPEDVIFTYKVFTEKGRPPYSDRMKKIEKIEKTGEHKVRFTFNENSDREFPLVVALTPILPEHAFNFDTFDETTLKPVIGSGAYRIVQVVPGQRIVFERNPDYWAKDIPAKRGVDNYDRITIDYFLNANSQFEAFKKGLCSIQTEADPVKRERDFDFPAVKSGQVVLETFETGLPPVVTGFLFNTRLPKFADVRVRRALAMLYDFEWANRNLFAGQYQQTVSYWQNTELSAIGQPASDFERKLLAPFPDAVLPELMNGTYRPPRADGSGGDRKLLRAALDLLKEAGFSFKDRKLLQPSGEPFGFEILIASQSEERLATIYQRTLQKIGIDVTIRALEADQIQMRKQRFDFEALIGTTGFQGTLSPGIELLFRWGSASRDAEGSFNLAGVADPAIDAVIEAILNADSRENYVAAVRSLDRLLISGAYIVPTQHNTEQFMAYWNYLEHPDKTPIFGYQLFTWWRKPD